MSASFVEPQGGQLVPGSEAAALVERLIAPVANAEDDVLALFRAHSIPPGAVNALVARVAPAVAASTAWLDAVGTDRARGDRLERLSALTADALSSHADDVALLPSGLGWMWSSDVDVLVRAAALHDVEQTLRVAGFIDLNPLLVRLDRVTPDVRRFASSDGAEVLGPVELCLRLGDDGPPADAAIGRSEWSPGAALPVVSALDCLGRRAAKIASARRVPLRSVLELLALLEEVPETPRDGGVAIALRRAAALEHRLGGRTLRISPVQRTTLLNRAWVGARAQGISREAVRRIRPRRLQVVFSGIDGSGKSTQVALLAENLERVNVPCATAWVRLGFSGSLLLSGAARIGQRLLPAGRHSAHVARATGVGDTTPSTRRGILGWAWALTVTADFVVQVHRAVRRSRGRVGVFDRGSADALIGLEHGYGGVLRLGLHRRLLGHLVRRPDHTFYLRVPGAVAYARKEDMFAPGVVDDFVARYELTFPGRPGVTVLDAERPRDELALEVLRRVAGDYTPAASMAPR